MAVFRYSAGTSVSLEPMALDFIFFTFLKRSVLILRILYIVFNVVAYDELTNLGLRSVAFKLQKVKKNEVYSVISKSRKD